MRLKKARIHSTRTLFSQQKNIILQIVAIYFVESLMLLDAPTSSMNVAGIQIPWRVELLNGIKLIPTGGNVMEKDRKIFFPAVCNKCLNSLLNVTKY